MGLILLLALVLRVGWVAAFCSNPVSDAQAYQHLARQLASGGWYGFDGRPYTYWPVGYPFLLSLEIRAFGDQPRLLAIGEVLLGTGIVALTMLMCRQWVADPRAALWAGFLVAVYPMYVEFAAITTSEALFTVLLLGACCCWGNLRELPYGRVIGAGVLLGLATYVRPVALPLAMALFLGHWIRWRRVRLTIVPAALTLAACLAVLAPWTLRNYHVYDRFVLVSTNGGMNLYFGNNPDAPGVCQSIAYPAHFQGNDAERDEYCRDRAMAFIKADPIGFVKRSIRKAAIMWERSTIGIAWSEPGIESRLGRRGVMILKLLSQAFWIVFLCVAVVAVPSLWRKAGPAAILGNPCIWTCLILTILYSITSAQDRYHYPCTAFLAVLVGHYIALRRK